MVTYTTAARVASILQYLENSSGSQVRLTFDGSSLPTLTEVESLITEVEDIIDQYCSKSWKSNTVTNEYYDFLTGNRNGLYRDRAGYVVGRIKIKNDAVKTFASGSGDKIEIKQNASWVDALTNFTEATVMYEDDFFIDYQRSRIYFFNNYPDVGKNTVRLTYRYGESSVPSSLGLAATYLTAAYINERYEMYKQIDKDTLPAMNMSQIWEKRAFMFLDRFKLDDFQLV